MSKVALIGCGSVGCSFLYSSMNQGLASEYGLIDLFEGAAIGNALDFEDAIASLPKQCKVKHITYEDLGSYDYIMIAAGRPQKPGESRLDMVKDNVLIMREIAQKVKASGFKGITLIASNPVDVITYAYAKYTGFDASKVIGSGTALDTSRLKMEISKDLNISTSNIDGAYVIGEHGDSSVSVFSNISVSGKKLDECKSKFNESNYEELLEKFVAKKAYSIIEKKRATFYGIGAAMSKILAALIGDTNEVLVVGSLLNGEYGYKNIVLGTPCVISKAGIKQIVELKLNNKEKEKLQRSYEIIKKINDEAVSA